MVNKHSSRIAGRRRWWLLLLLPILALLLLLYTQRQELGFLWKMHEAYYLMDRHYLEPLSAEELGDAAVSGMISSLQDPYAAYYDEEAYAEKQVKQQGNMVGIGVSVIRNGENGRLLISQVYAGSPAEEEGLAPGDWIVAADGVSFDGITADEALALIAGESGTSLTLTLLRGDTQLEKTLTRAEVSIPSVEYRLYGTTAYLRITTFNELTAEEFHRALEQAQAEGAEALIFDLRSNVGGLINAAFAMLDELLPEGTLATKVEKDGTQTVLATSDAGAVELPMAVLTDGYTASSSELFAAALRDYDAAVLVGAKTYGKGIMQTTYTLTDSTAVKFTTAYFNPPCGENFQGIGITPDVLVEELPGAEDFGDAKKDPVVARALEELSVSDAS